MLGGHDPTAKMLGTVLDSVTVIRSGANVSGRVRLGSEVLDYLLSKEPAERGAP
jgi:hypothetical protein